MKKPLIAAPGGSTEKFRLMNTFLGRCGGWTMISVFLAALILCQISFQKAAEAKTETYEAAHVPWSGYWWPKTQGGLGTGIGYRGRPAPLEKYELLTTGRYPGELTHWYLDRFYDPDAPYWYGMCAYWAWAAAYENIDILPSSEDNIVFRVGDKKGLLTLAHENDLLEQADGFDPAVFHYWLLHYIRDLRKPFVADLESVDEVWSYPIFRYDMITSEGDGFESVRVTLYYADDFVHPDYMGTKILSKVLTYKLFVSEDAIYGGEWTGNSAYDPPRRLTFPVAVDNVAPGMDYQTVLYLANSADDIFEDPGNPAVDMDPGTYQLVLLDEDRYRPVAAVAGDVIRGRIEKQAGSVSDLLFEIADGTGQVATSSRIQDVGTPFTFAVSVEIPPYTISIRQDDYADPNIYTLELDVVREDSLMVPYLPKNGMWSGFAITNPGDQVAKNVFLTAHDVNGNPVQTLLGPLDLGPGEKNMFVIDDLPYRRHEWGAMNRAVVTSESPLELVNLFAGSQNAMACFNGRMDKTDRLVFPNTSAPLSLGKTVFAEVINRSLSENAVRIAVYSKTGSVVTERFETIGPMDRLFIKGGTSPFTNMPDGGWVEVQGSAPSLVGYEHERSASSAESIHALAVEAETKRIPHVPPPGYWITKLTLINPNDSVNTVTIHPAKAGDDTGEDMVVSLNPHEKRVMEIQDVFGRFPDDPLYRSVLELRSAAPVAGYVTYVTPNDEVGLPLSGDRDAGARKTLPHCAGGGEKGWWTGICVYNPMTRPVVVAVSPYDRNGLPMSGKDVVLAAGEYTVFTVENLLGADMAGSVSFINFSAEDGEIGGFYLYGNQGNTMLSGAAM